MLKRGVERVLAAFGPARVAARMHRGQTIILAYHNVVPDGFPRVGDRSLHLPLTDFKRQLDVLETTHSVISLEDMARSDLPSDRPRVVITFDDAYRGALELALPELERRRLPTTVFVTPGILSSSACWWDSLAGVDGEGLPGTLRAHVLKSLRGDDTQIIAWARSTGRRPMAMPEEAHIASEDGLRRASLLVGVTFGAHSWSHRNLSLLTEPELFEELEKPMRWLNQRFGNVLPFLAYPYGLASTLTDVEASRAGYRAVLRIDGGWVTGAGVQSFLLPRLNIPSGLSYDGFSLRVSGLIKG